MGDGIYTRNLREGKDKDYIECRHCKAKSIYVNPNRNYQYPMYRGQYIRTLRCPGCGMLQTETGDDSKVDDYSRMRIASVVKSLVRIANILDRRNMAKEADMIDGMMRKVALEDMLQRLLDLKLIWIDGGEYVGKAEDGEEVNLGMVGKEDALMDYLSMHPSPKDW